MLTDNTFDTTVALASLYLWLLFGYLASFMNCDMQRFMNESAVFRHVIAIIAFFFLFTVLDSNNKAPVSVIWLKTLFVYILFIMAIKSKWYFAFPVLAILLADQTIKAHINYLEKNDKPDDIKVYQDVRKFLNTVIIIIIVVGFVHYAVRQALKFGPEFSFMSLLIGTSCSMQATQATQADQIRY